MEYKTLSGTTFQERRRESKRVTESKQCLEASTNSRSPRELSITRKVVPGLNVK